MGESSSTHMQPRQTVLALAINHREDEMERNPLQTHMEGLQMERVSKWGEEAAQSVLSYLQPYSDSPQPPASHAVSYGAVRSCQGSAGGWQSSMAGPSYIWKDPRRRCRQSRTKERTCRDSTEQDLTWDSLEILHQPTLPSEDEHDPSSQ